MNPMELKTYEILKDKLGEEKAATILGFAQEKFDQQKNIFLTKDDKLELIRCVKDDKLELIKSAKEDKLELIRSAKEDKVDLIKWMVGFWIAQIAAIIGLYFKR